MSKGIAEIAGGVAAIAGAVILTAFGFPEFDSILFSLGGSLIMAGIGTLLEKSHGVTTVLKNPVKNFDVIYGQCAVNGTMIFIEETGTENRYLHMVVVLAACPCQAIGSNDGTYPHTFDGVFLNGGRVLFTPGSTNLIGDSQVTLQTTKNITNITRVNDVVTVTTDGPMPLAAGDQINIKNVTADDTLNGHWWIQTSNSSTNFSYICGGVPVNITLQGQAETMFANWGTNVHVEYALGNQSAENPPFPGLLQSGALGSNTEWTENMLLLGKTAVYLRFQYSQNLFANGLPSLTFRVTGKNDIYDPRTGTTGYTANAALCIADYLSNTKWGFKAAYHTEIPDAQLTADANVSDEAVDLAAGGTEPRYQCNGTFDIGVGRGQILQNLLTSCGGRLTYSGGEFAINAAAWRGSSFVFGGSASTRLARQFSNRDNVNFGNPASLYIEGDWSFGCWINIPATGSGAIVGFGEAGSSDPTGHFPYLVFVNPSATAGLWDIGYSHDGGTSAGITNPPPLIFTTGIPSNTWLYIGLSRTVATSTVTLYTSYDGVTLSEFGSQVYSQLVNTAAQGSGPSFQLGMLPGPGPLPSSGTFASESILLTTAYMWNSALVESDQALAMVGSPPTSTLVFTCDLTQASVVSTTTAGTLTGTISGTSLVGGVLSGPSINSVATGPYQWKPKLSSRDLYNAVKGKFQSVVTQFQTSDYPYFAQDELHGYGNGPSADHYDANLAADGGDRRYMEQSFPFTTSVACCQRLAKIALMRLRQQGRATFSMNMQAYRLALLDVGTITLPALQWANKLMEVTGTRLTMNKATGGGDGSDGAVLLGVELDMQEVSPGIYDWDPAAEELSMAGFSVGGLTLPGSSASTPAGPTGLTLTSGSAQSVIGADGIARSQILATWSAPQDGYVQAVGVQYQLVGATTWTALTSVSASVTQAYISNVIDGQSYNVQIASTNVQGASSAWLEAGPITVSGTASTVSPSIIGSAGATAGEVLQYSSATSSWVPTVLPVDVQETPVGSINGTNVSFTLSYAPLANSLELVLNGLTQDLGVDYSFTGQTITYSNPLVIGDLHEVFYTH